MRSAGLTGTWPWWGWISSVGSRSNGWHEWLRSDQIEVVGSRSGGCGCMQARGRQRPDGERQRWGGALASSIDPDPGGSIPRRNHNKTTRATIAIDLGHHSRRAGDDDDVRLGAAVGTTMATPAIALRRCGARARVQVAPRSSSPSCAATGVLLVGGTAATEEIDSGGEP
jgi:hypothetical protein